MFRYFRNFSLLIVLSLTGCFFSFIIFVFSCIVLLLTPLLAFHVQTLLKISKEVSDE